MTPVHGDIALDQQLFRQAYALAAAKSTLHSYVVLTKGRRNPIPHE
jgi:hypothetical protein